MKQGKGTDVLGANDPRSAAIGVIYVSPIDDRKSVLAAILTQEKLGRKQVAVVLPQEQNKAFQRPGDFDDLKAMRRKLQTQVIFIAPSGPGPAEFARQRRFLVYSSLENYANALRDESQIESATKKGWLFGSPKAKAENVSADGDEMQTPAQSPVPATQEINTPVGRSTHYDSDEDESHTTGPVLPFIAGAALGGGAALASRSALDANGGNSGNGVASGNGRPVVDQYQTMRQFADDDDLGPPLAAAGRAPEPATVSGSTQAIPAVRPGDAAAADAGGSIIELRPHRSGKATMPLTPREPDPVPATPVLPESEANRPRRSTGKMMAAGAAGVAAGAVVGAGVASAVAAAPARGATSQGRASAAAGVVAPRASTPGGVPPRSTPPPNRGGGGGGRGNGRGPTRRRGWVLPLIIILALLLLFFGSVMAYAYTHPNSGAAHIAQSLISPRQSSVTVTITPDSKTVQDTFTITGGTTTNATTRQVAVRTIKGAAVSASVPVKATGHAQHVASSATGQITFFNSLSYSRQINAGQTLNAGGGIQIVITQTAFIPAAVPPLEGSIPVSAQATAGRGGNIGAYTFNGTPCCATGITLSNTAAFTGGQDAVNYAFLQQSDVSGAVSQAIQDATKQTALNDVSRQLRSGEQLLGSPQCTTALQADEPIGDKGTNVNNANVSYVIKCTAMSYDSQGAQGIVTGLITQEALTTPGAGYALVNSIQVTFTSQTGAKNPISFFFSGKGVWVYQFTDVQKLNIAKSIAGKSVTDAQNILKGMPGVGNATLNASGDTLPTDYNQISIVIQPVGGLSGGGGSTPVVGSPTITQPTIQSGTPGANGKGGSAPTN